LDSNFASQLKIKGPPNYRGTFEVEIRGSIIDVTNSNSVKTATRSSTLLIEINPVADMIVGRTTAIGTEDGGPIAFGAELKNGMRLKDETETISTITIDVPADSLTTTYDVQGGLVPSSEGIFPGSGSAKISFDSINRVYTIFSDLVADEASFASVNQSDRETASVDILNTLASFSIEIGPEHNDQNGDIKVAVTTLDVKNGKWDSMVSTFNPLLIKAVADVPS